MPRTATYMCIWAFSFGAMVGSVPPSFLDALGRMVSCLIFNFSDRDNSLPPDFDVILDPDITIVSFNLKSLDISVRGKATALQLALLNGLAVRFEDLGGQDKILIDIPTVAIRLLSPLSLPSSSPQLEVAPFLEVASITTDLSIVIGLSSSGWKDRARIQLAFVAQQDRSTRRCPFIYGQGLGGDFFSQCVLIQVV